MERLTVKRPDGRWAIAMSEGEKPRDQFEKIPKVVDRLAAYEDTGLEPEEIREVQAAMAPIPFGRFRDIMEADKDGRLVVLPCKVGDTVYQLFAPDGWKREPVIFMHALMSVEEVVRRMNKFGKTFFLTLEEAERALEGGSTDA